MTENAQKFVDLTVQRIAEVDIEIKSKEAEIKALKDERKLLDKIVKAYVPAEAEANPFENQPAEAAQ